VDAGDPSDLERTRGTCTRGNGGSEALHWTAVSRENGEVLISLDGEITSDVELHALFLLGAGRRVVLDLGRVRRINSHGVLELIGFLDAISSGRPIEARHCSVAVVGQLNLIPLLQDLLRVRSFYAPLECPACDGAYDLLIAIDDIATRPPELPHRACTECGVDLELAEPAERYFAFLQ
jgi:hypothetical protein